MKGDYGATDEYTIDNKLFNESEHINLDVVEKSFLEDLKLEFEKGKILETDVEDLEGEENRVWISKLCESSTIKKCSSACLKHDVECDFKECKHWLNFSDDHNCDLISIAKHPDMTLREISERLGISFPRVQQIQTAALKKLSKKLGVLGQD